MSAKVVLVTGASRGIGAAIALKFGKAGYRVVVHHHPSESDNAKSVCNQLSESLPVQFDLTEEGACQELVKLTKSEFGQLDVLVNNAGISIDQVLAFAKPEDFDKTIAVNLKPVFLLSKFGAKAMIRQKSGRIINISSVVGYTGNAGQSIYATTKAAITGFTKSIAQDLAGFNILANCVAPGFIKTDMTDALPEAVQQAILARVPLRRLGSAEDVANAVEFLASDSASYITGTTIHVNGGMYTS